ncbi:unnamed protein product [Phytophthora fragariaefolia]|uniref:Unnamed protein product n=1 Tax=Phytophthora fragariaefolia TaxID=1490495 RepID=A0A9W6X1Q7_9STRA|nr:unnamed protein product [Phytophthora fragariaefolia]
MMSEELGNLQYAHDELQLLQRETEATNELTAAVVGGPTSSGYGSSFCILLERVVRVLNGKQFSEVTNPSNSITQVDR